MALNLQQGTNTLEDDKKKNPLLGLQGQPGSATPFDPTQAFGAAATLSPLTNPVAIRNTSALQFNPEFAARNVGLQRQEADLGLQKNQGIQSIGQQYERATGEASEQQTLARQKLLEKMSGQGILASGITGQESGKLQQAFQKYLDDLAYNRARGEADVESQYAQQMNLIAQQREGLYGEQQQVEEARRVEAARVAAEQARMQQEAALQQQILQQQQAAQAAQAAAMQAALQAIQAPVINIGGGGGGGYGAGSPSAPQPQGTNWNAPAANFDDIVSWANQMRGQYAGNRAGFDADVGRLLQTDPNWSGSMQNAMGTYFGGAQSLQDVINWLRFPTAPLLNRGIQSGASQQYANMGVM